MPHAKHKFQAASCGPRASPTEHDFDESLTRNANFKMRHMRPGRATHHWTLMNASCGMRFLTTIRIDILHEQLAFDEWFTQNTNFRPRQIAPGRFQNSWILMNASRRKSISGHAIWHHVGLKRFGFDECFTQNTNLSPRHMALGRFQKS